MTTRQQTRFIAGEDIGSVAGWNFESVDQSALRRAEQAQASALEQAQSREAQIRQEARAQGFAEGHLQGIAQASAEGQRQLAAYMAEEGQTRAQVFAQLMQSAQNQLEAAQQTVAQGVLELACQLAREVLREELTVNPNVLQPVIREALSMMTADTRTTVVRLHPADRDMLGPIVQAEFADLSLNLVADSQMERGGCVLECAGALVDGSLPTRWASAVSRLGITSVWEQDHADSSS